MAAQPDPNSYGWSWLMLANASAAPSVLGPPWMRDQRPEELFDNTGRLVPELKALPPVGNRRMSANPHANGGMLKRAL